MTQQLGSSVDDEPGSWTDLGEAAVAARAAADTPENIQSDLSGLARLRSWRPSPEVVRTTALIALIANVLIVVTGGAVRLTDSGLGCPTWPTCTTHSLVPTAALGVHGVVEFTNRMLNFGISAAVGAVIVVVMRSRTRRPILVRLSWALFAGVVIQAVIGGISVRTHLAPIWVALHLVVSMGLIAAAFTLWVRTGEGDEPMRPTVNPYLRTLAIALTVTVGALIIAGTIVTGSGPHSGAQDLASAARRFPISPANATQLHADLVFLVVGLTIALWFGLKAANTPDRIPNAVRDLFIVTMAQGVIGYVQYFTHLPVLLVGIHMFGACLVWIATWRVLLAMRTRTA